MRVFLSFSVALLFCSVLAAQITITTSDMPVAGDTLHAYRDTLPVSFSIGQKGSNRTWDFSNLQSDRLVTTFALAPSSTPYAGTFASSNLALTNDFNAYLYYSNSASSLKVDGFASNDASLGVISVTFSPKPDQYRFPTTYLSKFTGSSGFVASKPYNQLPQSIKDQIDAALTSFPGASVSQVRVTFTSNYTDTIDAWGTVITPLGGYDALRRKRIENSNTKIEAQVSLIFPPTTFWQEISNTSANTTEHSWLSKITKLPLVSLGYDSLRNITSVAYSDIPPPPVAAYTWVNTSGGLVNFTNTSQNNPLSYSWDFGDGATSTQQTPSHVYGANGAYYACLTVSNASGSDTFCDTVRVTAITPFNNPPIANRDSAQIVYPAKATINLLANDIDPDGDSIVYNIFFPPLNGTVTHLGNGVIEYEANSNFRGIDSFFYKISDNGSPVKSDTGTVVIEVDGLPAADFTYSASGFDVTFQNISSGFDSIFWDLGDGATATTNTVVHTYARGAYNVCLTAYNAFGADTTCKTVDLTDVGVAGISENIIKIYPNPATNKVMVEINGLKGKYKIALYNSTGKLVLQDATEQETLQLNVSGLPAGTYCIRINNEEGKIVRSQSIFIADYADR